MAALRILDVASVDGQRRSSGTDDVLADKAHYELVSVHEIRCAAANERDFSHITSSQTLGEPYNENYATSNGVGTCVHSSMRPSGTDRRSNCRS